MNLQSPRRWIPAIAVSAIALVLFGLTKLDGLFFADLRYQQCTRFAATDGAKALALARKWLGEHPGSPMARHCEAIVLFAVKDYPHAAKEFLMLGHDARAANAAVSARLLQQAAQSYEAAGELDAAATSAAEALALAPESPEIKLLAIEIKQKRATPSPPAAPPPPPRKIPG